MQIVSATKKAVVVGSSNWVGKHCLNILLRSDIYSEVVAIDRKKWNISHPKLRQLVVDYDDLDSFAEELIGDDIYCCLRTSVNFSDKEWLRTDFKYSYDIAQIAAKNGVGQFLFLSSAGANASALFFYNKFKGQIEKLVQSMDFWSVHIFKPSFLLEESNEDIFGEELSNRFRKFVDGFTGGFVSRYRPVEAEYVAKAMFKVAQNATKNGIFVYESEELGDENKLLN